MFRAIDFDTMERIVKAAYLDPFDHCYDIAKIVQDDFGGQIYQIIGAFGYYENHFVNVIENVGHVFVFDFAFSQFQDEVIDPEFEPSISGCLKIELNETFSLDETLFKLYQSTSIRECSNYSGALF